MNAKLVWLWAGGGSRSEARRQAAPAGGVPARLPPTLTRFWTCRRPAALRQSCYLFPCLISPIPLAVSTLANRAMQIGSLQGAAQLFSKASGSVSGILADVVTPARSAVAASYSRFDHQCMHLCHASNIIGHRTVFRWEWQPIACASLPAAYPSP